ncbi:MAG TPA: immunoglobulin-like domain-containing protein, partial [Verrucomicrobiae bacterium]
TVIGWGQNTFGIITNVPASMTNLVAVAAGGVAGNDFNIVLRNDGTLAGWGGSSGYATNTPTGLTNLNLTINGGLNTNAPGSYPLVYICTNIIGGSAFASRTVVVADTIPPVITVFGNNPMTNGLNVPFVDPGATALDACGGSFPVATNSTVNVTVPGIYTVTYTSTDAYGNSTNQVRAVVVISQPSVAGPTSAIIGTNAANGSRTVQLTVSVNPNGLPTAVNFQFGVTAAYAGANGPVSLPASFVTSNVTVAVDGFSSGSVYHWNAMATNSAGSASSPDQTFYISPQGIPGDVNGDGVVSASELNAVYANYVTNSPWLALTNVAGLGGSNVSFDVSNSIAGNYSIQYSTNLADWIFLGRVAPRYQFVDTNAPASPQRYYRLVYP